MVGLELLFCLLAVSLLWGITNPLLKRASVGIENIQMSNPVLQVCVICCKVMKVDVEVVAVTVVVMA